MIARRSAFTLVELLVVIAIIGILIAMLLPAVQASRESARRVHCVNQMRQLALAMHNYHLAQQSFPPGVVNPEGPVRNVPEGMHRSWTTFLLPYLDEPAKYAHLDLDKSMYHRANNLVRQTTADMLTCASDANDVTAMSSYAACHNDREAPIDADNNGVFFRNSAVTYDDLTDGAGYTLLIGEKRYDPEYDLGWMSGTPATLRNTGSPFNKNLNERESSGTPPWLVGSEWQDDPDWNSWELEDQADSPFEGEDSPDVQEPEKEQPEEAEGDFLAHSLEGGRPDEPLEVGGFGSYHVGGVNFALADGSVRLLSDNIAPGLLRRLANRKDGKLVSSQDF